MITAARRRLSSSVLGYRDYRLLWLGQTISTLGDQVFPFAVAVAVLQADGDESDYGLVIAARLAALVLFVLVGGIWADRLSRRLVMIGADAFRAAIVASIALFPGQMPLGVLAALVFLVGAGEAFFRPAEGAMLPTLLPEERRQAGNGLMAVSLRTGAFVGPGVGAPVAALLGVRPTFLIIALAFVASMLCLLFLREPAFSPNEPQSIFRDVKEGFAEVWRRKWITWVLVLAAAQLMVVFAPPLVLLPFVTEDAFGTHGELMFGLALSAFAAGGVLGAIIGMRWKPLKVGLWSVLGWLLYSLDPIALLFPFSEWWVLACYLIAGVGLEPFLIYWMSALQREIPGDKLARVTSIDWLCSLALMPVGLVLTGPAVDAFGRAPVLVFAAVFNVVTSLLMLLVPGFIHMRTPQQGRHRASPTRTPDSAPAPTPTPATTAPVSASIAAEC